MAPEESDAVVGRLMKEWVATKARRACALEKFKLHQENLLRLAEIDPTDLAASSPFGGRFSGPADPIFYPEGEELNRLVGVLKESGSKIEQLQKRLNEAGIPIS